MATEHNETAQEATDKAAVSKAVFETLQFVMPLAAKGDATASRVYKLLSAVVLPAQRLGS